MPKLIAISDLHIEGDTDPLYRALLKLIDSQIESDDVLILAGDIFDFWVGNKDLFREKYSKFIDLLKAKGNLGSQIYYIEGNHDFHLRRVFKGFSHTHLCHEEIDLELFGKRFFIAHGDLVDSSDYGYRIMRAVFRSHPARAAVKSLSDSLLEKIGNRASKTSRKLGLQMNGVLPLHKMNEVRTKFRSYAAEKMSDGYDFVILGHCHDDDEMRFRVGDREGQYMNIGYPRVHGTYVQWKNTDKFMRRYKIED